VSGSFFRFGNVLFLKISLVHSKLFLNLSACEVFDNKFLKGKIIKTIEEPLGIFMNKAQP